MIEFPKMGLRFNINPVAISLFGVNIYWYGIIIAIGFMIAFLLALKQSGRFDIKQEEFIDMLLYTVPLAIIGARLYYIIFNYKVFKDNPMQIFNIRTGGIAIYGAIIFSVISVYTFCKIKKISILKMFDFGCVYLVLGQAIGRWGNFINQEAFGSNTLLPWGMTGDKIRMELLTLSSQGVKVDPMIPVHPTFLYESLWSFLIFGILLWYRNRKKLNGEVFYIYMILYGIGRAFIEGLRMDSLYLGSFRVSQVLSIAFVVSFIIVLTFKRKKPHKI